MALASDSRRKKPQTSGMSDLAEHIPEPDAYGLGTGCPSGAGRGGERRGALGSASGADGGGWRPTPRRLVTRRRPGGIYLLQAGPS